MRTNALCRTWFHVSMNNAAIMQLTNGIDNLAKNGSGGRFAESPLVRLELRRNEIMQIFPRSEFHNHVHFIKALNDLITAEQALQSPVIAATKGGAPTSHIHTKCFLRACSNTAILSLHANSSRRAYSQHETNTSLLRAQ